MEYRRLGKSSLIVSAMGLGCMGMSQSYGTPDDTESVATIHHAIDRGITMLDTADMYGGGKNEELGGAAIAKRRNEIILATKFGNMRMPDGRFLGVNGKPEYVQEACEACLKRLKISTIDLFYLHRVDTNVPIEETIGAMARLIEQGKVRYIGLSEAGAKTIRRAHATYPITALQSEFSLWTRDLEAEILGVCRELGIGIVPYSPLGRGFLTGKVKKNDFGDRDFRRMSPRFQGENFQRIWKLCGGWKRWPKKNIARPRSSHWRGCSQKEKTWFRYREQSAESISTKTLRHWRFRLPPRISRGLTGSRLRELRPVRVIRTHT